MNRQSLFKVFGNFATTRFRTGKTKLYFATNGKTAFPLDTINSKKANILTLCTGFDQLV